MTVDPDAATPDDPPVDPASAPTRGPIRGLRILPLVLAPVALVVALTPAFTTQDGPAHLFNARIVAAALRLGDGSPYAAVYQVNARPVPNWAGHVATALAVEALPPLVAARAMTLLTLFAVVAGLMVARRAVAGADGLGRAAVLATLLALNIPWLFGFTGFLLGATLMPLTLAAWWHRRDRPSPGGTALIAALLVAGYFCHPISLAATVLGLGVLAVLTPTGTTTVGKRLLWLVLAALPLVPLGVGYARMTRSGGGMEPVWEHLGGRWASPRAWAEQLSWVEPLSLAAKTSGPGWWPGAVSPRFAPLLAPAAWAGAGLLLLTVATWRAGRWRDRRGWGVLAGLLLVAGLVGPDTLGVRHGYYLPQRLTLLGLMGLVPWLDLGLNRRSAWLGSGLLGLALGLQTLNVGEYAGLCRDRVGGYLAAGPSLPPRARVGSIVVGTRSRFLSNPLLHADCLFGVDLPRVVWGNYETDHYYFPVQVRPGVVHPPAAEFEQVSLMDGPADADRRARRWEILLQDHHARIDAVVTWGATPALDVATARWYQPTTGTGTGPTRVWLRRALLLR